MSKSLQWFINQRVIQHGKYGWNGRAVWISQCQPLPLPPTTLPHTYTHIDLFSEITKQMALTSFDWLGKADHRIAAWLRVNVGARPRVRLWWRFVDAPNRVRSANYKPMMVIEMLREDNRGNWQTECWTQGFSTLLPTTPPLRLVLDMVSTF